MCDAGITLRWGHLHIPPETRNRYIYEKLRDRGIKNLGQNNKEETKKENKFNP